MALTMNKQDLKLIIIILVIAVLTILIIKVLKLKTYGLPKSFSVITKNLSDKNLGLLTEVNFWYQTDS